VYDLEGDERRNVDVATQLSKGGYDADALNASAFVKGIATLSVVEKLLASARRQLSVTLREALVRREFKVRAEQVNKRLISSTVSCRRRQPSRARRCRFRASDP